MRRTLLGILEPEAWATVHLPFEYGIDAVAEALAGAMPLPGAPNPSPDPSPALIGESPNT